MAHRSLPNHLLWKLGTPNAELIRIVENIDQYYYQKKKPKLNPDGTQKTKNGVPQTRVLYPPLEPLKTIQRKINRKILFPVALPECVRGGIKGQDNINNANTHLGKKYHFTTDLRDFFPSVNPKMVHRFFVDLGYPPDIARLLTQLTTYKYQLPQGAPTSSYIANLIFVPVDLKLLDICQKHEMIYTRWIDDLSFSSQHPIQQDAINQILDTIRASGFRISHGQKTGYKIGRTLITGIDTGNNTLKIRTEQYAALKEAGVAVESRLGKARYAIRVNPNNARAKEVLHELQ